MMDRVIRALLPARVEDELARACGERRSQETCGVLFGSRIGDKISVEGFALVRNDAENPDTTFRFSPGDWVSAYYEAQKNRRDIVGFFHSHPDGSVSPSGTDGEGWLTWGSYWIIGINPDGCRFAAYTRDSNGQWEQLPVTVNVD